MTMDEQNRLLRLLQAPPAVLERVDHLLEGRPDEEKTQGPLLLQVGEAAKLLGVSRTTVWRMAKAHRLGRVEILPGSFRIPRADILRLAAGAGAASAGIEPRRRSGTTKMHHEMETDQTPQT